MSKLDVKYLKILEEAKNDPAIVGLIFGGSRGKSTEFLTTNSDYDVILIVSNDTDDELKKKMENYKSPGFEIWVRTTDEFISDYRHILETGDIETPSQERVCNSFLEVY